MSTRDTKNETLSADTATATGIGTVKLETPTGYVRFVQRAMVIVEGMDSDDPNPTFDLYIDEARNGSWRSGTSSGHKAEAEYPNPIVVPEGQALVGRWNGLTAGARAQLTIQSELRAVTR